MKKQLTHNEKWESKYNELVAYGEKNGHFSVSYLDKENKRLLRWITAQRQAYKYGTLKADREERLKEIGFQLSSPKETDKDKEDWENNFNELLRYKEKFNDIDFKILPKDHEHHALSIWCNTQRVIYRAGKIQGTRKQRLEEIGFAWDVENKWKGSFDTDSEASKIGSVWLETYEMYINYNLEHDGDLGSLVIKNRRIHDWARRQIREIKQGTISQAKMDLLEMIDFNVELFELQQTVWYESFQKHKKHARIIRIQTEEERESYVWLRTQRLKYKDNELSAIKIRLLKEAGVDLEDGKTLNPVWLKTFEEFKKYNDLKQGDLNNLAEDNEKLYLWFVKQKKHFNQQELDKRKIQLLISVNKDFFEMRKIDTRWLESYEEFKQIELNSIEDVWALRENNARMYIWLRRQILAYKRGDLGINKEKALMEINFGFHWFDDLDV